METATVTIIAALALLLVLAVAVTLPRRHPRRHPRRRARDVGTPRASALLRPVDGRITLEVPTHDVDDGALRRLATQVAERALNTIPV